MAQRITARLWPDAATGPWRLAFAWVQIDGQYECVGLEITSEPRPSDAGGGRWPVAPGPVRPLTTSEVFRRLPLAQLIAEERRREALFARWTFETTEPGSEDDAFVYGDPTRIQTVLSVAAEDFEHWQSSGRADSRERWREAAEVYIAAGNSADPLIAAAPTKAVADHFSISTSAAAKMVARARKAGLLPPTTPGRANTSTPVPRRKR